MHFMLKKRIFSLLTLVLLMAASADASVQGSPDQRPKQKQTTVQANLEGTVEVSFKIDAQGHVEILSLASTSPQLADYVIKKLAQVKLEKGDPQVGQIIKYRFVFKKQA
jgi:outer membrane biosynthesis protein TonB